MKIHLANVRSHDVGTKYSNVICHYGSIISHSLFLEDFLLQKSYLATEQRNSKMVVWSLFRLLRRQTTSQKVSAVFSSLISGFSKDNP